MNIRFLAPLDIESASEITLLFRVLARGSQNYPTSADVRKKCDMLWGATVYPISSPLGEMQNIGFTATFINDRFAPDGESVFDGICGILKDLIFNPKLSGGLLDSEYVNSERENLICELKNEEDKAELCRFKMESKMFEGEKFNVCSDGDAEVAKKIDAKSLTEFYKNFIFSSPVEICLVADIDGEHAKKAVESIFDVEGRGIKRKERDFAVADVVRKSPRPFTKTGEKCDIVQSRVCVGFRSGCVLGDPNFEAFDLMCELLGRSPTNRLYTNLREIRGLCYSCALSSEVYKGLVRIECGCDSSNVKTASDGIFEQISAVADGRFGDDEFEDARASLVSAYKSIGDDPSSVISWYYRHMLAGSGQSPDEAIAEINAVSREDIMLAAARLDPDTLFVLGTEDMPL